MRALSDRDSETAVLSVSRTVSAITHQVLFSAPVTLRRDQAVTHRRDSVLGIHDPDLPNCYGASMNGD